MMAADYRHIGGRENRLGRHYSRFSAFWPARPLQVNHLPCENCAMLGRIGEVGLTIDDARAAGIGRSELIFNQVTQTANGRVRFASAMLREVRVEQLSIENVPAAVIENLDQSL